MLREAIDKARRCDPERVAQYEAWLAFVTTFGGERRQVGHRWFRRGMLGVEVEVGIGRGKIVGLPVSDEEALALASGRACVVMRGTVRSHSLRIVACELGKQDRREKPAPKPKRPESGFAQRVLRDGRSKRLAEIEQLIAGHERQIAKLEAERARLVARSAA